jgi:hypothetical protein
MAIGCAKCWRMGRQHIQQQDDRLERHVVDFHKLQKGATWRYLSNAESILEVVFIVHPVLGVVRQATLSTRGTLHHQLVLDLIAVCSTAPHGRHVATAMHPQNMEAGTCPDILLLKTNAM